MDKFAAMRTFVEIAERGSVTAAAAALGRSQPAAARTLAKLEASLGVRLIWRTTRRLALTPEGRIYLDRCRRILADVEDAQWALGIGETEPRGDLRLTAPVTYGQWHIAPALTEFTRRHRAVRLDLLLLDRVVNLLEEGVDLAVRIGPLADSSMIATGVGSMRRVVVASPDLLERVGEPEHPRALSDHECVLFRGLSPGGRWRFLDHGAELSVPVSGRFTTNQAVAAVEACASGLGFGSFLAYQVQPWLDAGALRVVLEDYERPAVPVSLVYNEARMVSPRLRALIDFLKAWLAQPRATRSPAAGTRGGTVDSARC